MAGVIPVAQKVEAGTRVDQADSVIHKLMTAPLESNLPTLATGPDLDILRSIAEQDGALGSGAHCGGLGQDFLHAADGGLGCVNAFNL